ncbi:MAG: GNAT family N-acetyltransferase [Deltaproteobacteria bacterium]|nr:GNAT family N-acetyltransferase [Deltaproteobacteria bacterium]
MLRPLADGDRAAIEAVLRSDETFRDSEVAVALELVDDGLKPGGSADYWFQVAEQDGQVAGYICYGPTPMTDATFDLYWIVVGVGFRGRGLAKTLVQAMEADLRQRGGRRVRVETEQIEAYSAARSLYQRLEYPLAAQLKDFYRQGEDLLIYYKEL